MKPDLLEKQVASTAFGELLDLDLKTVSFFRNKSDFSSTTVC